MKKAYSLTSKREFNDVINKGQKFRSQYLFISTVKADDFKKETIENVAMKEGLGNQAVLRSEEMVGINLQEILMNPGGKNDLILIVLSI